MRTILKHIKDIIEDAPLESGFIITILVVGLIAYIIKGVF